ncbi:MAG: hypothetical protein F4065_03780 [Rhodothermaceae bacterium]|nr:hypothetical protein [Bacteroidota bacterium]MXW15087.1 hypothetical protein [Rhodothermaceae bacterium]MDE2646280.1 hypothetical protein [Bacteroidota bacterium]MXW32082.1 hypothetical protein [Rhodothermaceae bacterium]MXX97750.1 hypothetical protein [Rhodothermaceae bacterium]
MSQLSLADIANGLDSLLDKQMTGQARIAAHLVAAAEGHGLSPSEVISIFDKIVEKTVLDELWVTDSEGIAYLTTVRGEDGKPIQFKFSDDSDTQPQASAFYPLLSASVDSDECITQAAQTREIDWNIFKYVGVSGIDKPRIVQVGNALAFEEQGLLNNSYASPVMTAALAAFGEAELLSSMYTSRVAEVRSVFDAVLSKQMVVQAGLIDAFLTVAEASGWSVAETNSRLHRIVKTTPISEIEIATTGGQIVLSSSAPYGKLRYPESLQAINVDVMDVVDHPSIAHDESHPSEKTVTVYSPGLTRIVQITTLLDDSSLVSPRFRIPD